MHRATRIVILEPSDTQAMKWSLVLEQQGWEITRAVTGAAALQQAEKAQHDLMLVGDCLPDLSWQGFRARLQKINPDVPVLLMSDFTESQSAANEGSVRPEVVVERIQSILAEPRHYPALNGLACADFHGGHILAIDDSPTHLEYLTETLRSEGYRVSQATGGKEGLEQVATHNFDCVLVDLVMPDMDGIQVCQKIQQSRPPRGQSAGIIILTAQETGADIARGLEAGADDFVGKSSDPTILKARMRALLRRRFFEREHSRLEATLKSRELEMVCARAETEAAQARAALAEKLAGTNRELEEANRKLKETQAHLIQSEKMASLGQLVAGIAHEINNPLAFVLNHAATVETALGGIQSDMHSSLSEAGGKKLAKAQTRLAEMQEGLARVKELVLNLRTFSRLDEGNFKTVDIHESIDSVLLFLKHKMGQIQLEKRYGANQPVSCYAGQLNQVLMNLIANAVDAIEADGKITIETRESGNHLLISVRDTGPGIPKDIQQRIFDPFFTTKPVGQGTGLGLAISYQIIQSHRGAIEVRSEENAGTEFTVRIPLDLEDTGNEEKDSSRR